jgi:hypothetical protein
MVLKWAYNTYEIKMIYVAFREKWTKIKGFESFPTLELITENILSKPVQSNQWSNP